MVLKINKFNLVVLDLDDTLYKEVEFLKSAYKEISEFIGENRADDVYKFMVRVYQSGGDSFGEVIERYDLNLNKDKLLEIYRNHIPDIKLEEGVLEFIETLKKKDAKIGLLTDGRSITQRNKLKGLEIEDLFDEIIISEEFGSAKPDKKNFNFFERKYQNYSKTYIADNFNKDFITPNLLGWRTIGVLDNGENIHKQNKSLSKEYLPQNVICFFSEIEIDALT